MPKIGGELFVEGPMGRGNNALDGGGGGGRKWTIPVFSLSYKVGFI